MRLVILGNINNLLSDLKTYDLKSKETIIPYTTIEMAKSKHNLGLNVNKAGRIILLHCNQ